LGRRQVGQGFSAGAPGTGRPKRSDTRRYVRRVHKKLQDSAQLSPDYRWVAFENSREDRCQRGMNRLNKGRATRPQRPLSYLYEFPRTAWTRCEAQARSVLSAELRKATVPSEPAASSRHMSESVYQPPSTASHARVLLHASLNSNGHTSQRATADEGVPACNSLSSWDCNGFISRGGYARQLQKAWSTSSCGSWLCT
jgi:hypothetical protein